MRVFVTGGYGFIGAHVVRQLLERGHTVRVLVHSARSDTRRLDGLGVEQAVGDVRDGAALSGAMADCEACIHLASPSAWADIRTGPVESVVVDGTRTVLRTAHAAGMRRVVFVSSATAVNASTRPVLFDETSSFELEGSGLRYALAKHRAERAVWEVAAETGLEVVVVNPGETYGPDDTGMVTAGNLRDMLRDWPALGCYGGTAVAYVEDVAAGVVLALDKGRVGERYILGGENMTVEQLIRMTLDIAGQRRKPVVILPNALVLGLVRVLTRFGLPSPVEPGVVEYATRYWFVDDRKARTELGYAPRPARQALLPTIAWLYRAGLVRHLTI
jgi:dihydroflavonol-4-reductase